MANSFVDIDVTPPFFPLMVAVKPVRLNGFGPAAVGKTDPCSTFETCSQMENEEKEKQNKTPVFTACLLVLLLLFVGAACHVEMVVVGDVGERGELCSRGSKDSPGDR